MLGHALRLLGAVGSCCGSYMTSLIFLQIPWLKNSARAGRFQAVLSKIGATIGGYSRAVAGGDF